MTLDTQIQDITLAANILGTNDVTFNSALQIDGNAIITSIQGDVIFTLDVSAAAGTETLEVNAFAGTADFQSTVGGGTAPLSLAVTGDAALAGNVSVTNSALFDGNVTLSGGAPLQIDVTANGGTMTFTGDINGAEALTLNATTAGIATRSPTAVATRASLIPAITAAAPS